MTAGQAIGDEGHTQKLHSLLCRLAPWHAAWIGCNATAPARNRPLGQTQSGPTQRMHQKLRHYHHMMHFSCSKRRRCPGSQLSRSDNWRTLRTERGSAGRSQSLSGPTQRCARS